jgi:hypothetical protein
MKVLTIEPVRPAWMQLHNAIKYSGFPLETVREGIASGAIRAFALRSQYHRKLKGIRPQIILVNVESLDAFIEAKEREADAVEVAVG